MAWGDQIDGNVFSTLGTGYLGSGYSDGYGGDGVSLAEQADVANGSYDYSGGGAGITAWSPLARDAVEQARMGAGYPDNGKPWDWNAATMGVSRLIDSASRAYVVANGGLGATYAGQNGLTYQNGRQVRSLSIGNNLLPLLLIAGAVFLMAK